MGVDPWPLGEFIGTHSMDANLTSLWSFHQTIEDLRQKLLGTTLELETLKSNAKQEIRKSEQTVNQLLEMLKAVTKERDEATQQLQLLLGKIRLQPNCRPDSPQQILQTGGGTSSITSSDNLSESLNHRHSYGSSPIDQSIFDVVSSPEFSSCMNMPETCNVSIPQQPKLPESKVNASNTSGYDQASAIIDRIAMNRPLPEKGNLLQAVQEAGPLLQNLLLAGPLPQWRTPPSTSLQPLFVPQLSAPPVKARPSASLMLDQSALPLVSFPAGPSGGLVAVKRSMNSTHFDDIHNSAKHQRIH